MDLSVLHQSFSLTPTLTLLIIFHVNMIPKGPFTPSFVRWISSAVGANHLMRFIAGIGTGSFFWSDNQGVNR